MLFPALLLLSQLGSSPTPREVEAQHLSDQLQLSLAAYPYDVVAGQVGINTLSIRNISTEPASGCIGQPINTTVIVARHNYGLGYPVDTPVTCVIPFHLAPRADIDIPFRFLVPATVHPTAGRIGLAVVVDLRILLGVEAGVHECIVPKRVEFLVVLAQ